MKKRQEEGYLEEATKIKSYKGEPIKCWKKAKELRVNIYKWYAQAHELGGIRVAGGAWSFQPIAAALGGYYLASEPYAASTAFDREFSKRCIEAAESKGWAPDICGYVKNYLGCIILDEYTFGGKWPIPDLLFQLHICCTHAKWYQAINEYEGGHIPFFSIDVSVGPYEIRPEGEGLKEYKLDYVVYQLLDAIEELDKLAQKKWGIKFDDEKFIEGVKNDCESTSLWAEICCLNKAIPAPIDEKSMFPFFNLAAISRHRKEVVDLYKELRDELKDRVERGIAALPTERCRVFGDSPPPWGHLDIYRYMEEYGVVSVGSFYVYGLIGMWEEDENGNRIPRKTPDQLGIEIKTREDAVRVMADWYLTKPYWKQTYLPELKSDMMIKHVRQWKCDGAVIHYNRGCELTTMGAPEVRLALLEAGIPNVTYEGNMADSRDFDEARTKARLDAFFESLGLKRLK
jgi:benzoyl-CoA reductase subunit B